jgi:FtsP/CotA-like multicopper oxidase with cupredoxin domain
VDAACRAAPGAHEPERRDRGRLGRSGPVPVKELTLAPAERADVLVDFTKFAGATMALKNHKPNGVPDGLDPAPFATGPMLPPTAKLTARFGRAPFGPRPYPRVRRAPPSDARSTETRGSAR